MKIRSGLEAFSVLESGATYTDLKEILELVTPKITKKTKSVSFNSKFFVHSSTTPFMMVGLNSLIASLSKGKHIMLCGKVIFTDLNFMMDLCFSIADVWQGLKILILDILTLTALSKICKNTGCLRTEYSRIKTESKILSL